jgi:hypothetical protein
MTWPDPLRAPDGPQPVAPDPTGAPGGGAPGFFDCRDEWHSWADEEDD